MQSDEPLRAEILHCLLQSIFSICGLFRGTLRDVMKDKQKAAVTMRTSYSDSSFFAFTQGWRQFCLPDLEGRVV